VPWQNRKFAPLKIENNGLEQKHCQTQKPTYEAENSAISKAWNKK
jgi:hypothetical protein